MPVYTHRIISYIFKNERNEVRSDDNADSSVFEKLEIVLFSNTNQISA